MKETQLAIVGAGPAGISGALEAASHGVKVTVIDRDSVIGGQLIKQTHKFFGWHKVSAGTRGIIIAQNMAKQMLEHPNITFLPDTEVLGYYSDGVLLLETPNGIERLKCERTFVATGAVEKSLLFPGNDLPGVYGAGAVQTLMNVHGVRPGQSVLMVGSGNIGLIVSYQLVQAGVKVAAIVEAAPGIGGYAVHASKVRRLGIPVLTSHTVKEVYGKDEVDGATIWQLDSNWQGVPGTEQDLDVDVVCIAIGLTPLSEILWQAGAEMAYVGALGGFVPLIDENMETTAKGVFVAGDAAGIEEASTAMAGGKLAGLCIAASLDKIQGEAFTSKRDEIKNELKGLRSGPTGAKIMAGQEQVRKLLEKRVSS